jgi:hypothetical protein
MKITAGENQRKAPQGSVFVVTGNVDYEGDEILAVSTSRKLAYLAIDSDKAIRKAESRWAFDKYSVRKFKLDTAIYRANFFTSAKVRNL